ncbi:hypothetical protein C8J56DRAFT_1029975 [Mycena floridula]|nr:hypothetical protein C8J56DRAFT_1124981 [Mycena floridula]KAJ7580579.1 hypothetical protein C8J56DRAFT_1029975 [Mycena floridula]
MAKITLALGFYLLPLFTLLVDDFRVFGGEENITDEFGVALWIGQLFRLLGVVLLLANVGIMSLQQASKRCEEPQIRRTAQNFGQNVITGYIQWTLQFEKLLDRTKVDCFTGASWTLAIATTDHLPLTIISQAVINPYSPTIKPEGLAHRGKQNGEGMGLYIYFENLGSP